MDIPENIKNRIINLTLYTRVSSKIIIKIVSTKNMPISIEDYYEVLEEYSQKTGKAITKGNAENIELKKIEDEVLIDLYLKDYSNFEMINYLLDNGYIISVNDLKNRLKELHAKGKLKNGRSKKKYRAEWNTDNLEDEIIKLFEDNYRYTEISKFLEIKGIKLTPQATRSAIQRIFQKRGQEIPKRIIEKRKKERNRKRNVKMIGREDYETIFNLREQKFTIKQIFDYYSEKGYKTSCSTIGTVCKKIYEEKGIKQPVLTRNKPNPLNEEIFKLSEQGMDFVEMEKYFKEKGIDIDKKNLCSRCSYMYRKKKMTARRKGNYKKSQEYAERVTSQDLINLYFIEHMSYKKVAEYYSQKGLSVSWKYIESRIKKIKKEISAELPINEKTTENIVNTANAENLDNKIDIEQSINIKAIDENQINKILLNLKNTKNATDEQLSKLAAYYGINFTGEINKTSPFIVKNEMEI